MLIKPTDLSVAADTLLFTRVLCLSKNSVGIVWKLSFLNLNSIVSNRTMQQACNQGKQRMCVPWAWLSCLGTEYSQHTTSIYTHWDMAKLSDIMGPLSSVHMCQITEGTRGSQLKQARTCFLCRKGAQQQSRKYRELKNLTVTFLLITFLHQQTTYDAHNEAEEGEK